ncbi:DUF1450 domain-containing protein [Mesobacillus harenae]|uniref:DUF1450 domain-containing protein n=1 Tax=Mesobacillus harenae TaxID=2213203 RepID=UPI0015812C56|nr:DUF1450 domain-containing protein [Mesobacillus harenae]
MKLIKRLFSKQKETKIDFCEKNLDRFLTEENFPAYNTFFNQKNIIYKEYNCQSRCTECKHSPYAIVDGEFMSAESADEFLEQLKLVAGQK